MINKTAAEARLNEINAELKRHALNPNLTQKMCDHMERLVDEGEELRTQLATRKAAGAWAGASSPYPSGDPAYGAGAPAGLSTWQLPEGEGSNIAQLKHHAPSPLDMTSEQLQDLFAAGKNKMSFSTTVGEGATHNKSLTGGMGIHNKAAMGEGAPGTLIPPILLPSAFSLRLEPTRIAEYLPAIAAEGQSVSWVQHQSNTLAASAMAVAELQQKPDIGPVVVSKETSFSVVAGMATVSRQLFSDFEDVASFMPREIGKQVILGENYQLLQGNGTSPNQLGLLNQTGTLTRVYSSTGGDTTIDCVLEAINDLRIGAAYTQPDLVILNPSDWTAMRKIKTSFGSYVLNPADPNQLGGIDNIFGVRVITSTQCPAGSGVVMDSKVAVNVFRRWNLETTANPYADSAFGTNAIIYRGETRFGLGVVYPAAINLLSGLDA